MSLGKGRMGAKILTRFYDFTTRYDDDSGSCYNFCSLLSASTSCFLLFSPSFLLDSYFCYMSCLLAGIESTALFLESQVAVIFMSERQGSSQGYPR